MRFGSSRSNVSSGPIEEDKSGSSALAMASGGERIFLRKHYPYPPEAALKGARTVSSNLTRNPLFGKTDFVDERMKNKVVFF